MRVGEVAIRPSSESRQGGKIVNLGITPRRGVRLSKSRRFTSHASPRRDSGSRARH